MAAKIIDGKKIAEQSHARVAVQAQAFLERHGRPPGLAVVQVGEDPASTVYVRNKRAKSLQLGIASFSHDLPANTTQQALMALVETLNHDARVDGILVQMPLPKHLDAEGILLAIDPAKDVDGLHPCNLGRLFSSQPLLKPCTPAGIMEIIHSTDTSIPGLEAVVVGRSNLVGKPAAMLLLQEHATVTLCHSRTPNLAAHCNRADILVVAIGRPRFIPGAWIKPGALVIDVGTNRTPEGKLCGDVDFESAVERAGIITPVPGGVGPMTIAMLMQNTLHAAQAREERPG